MSAKSQNTTYPAGFFSRLQHGAKRSAETIVPLVLELFPVESVLDVGCGTGAWLSVFMQHGVRDVVGVDGDYVDGEMLEIPATHFIATDLNNPLDLERRFDLVVALEVAEHLPEPRAEQFVRSLVRHASCILFSAAIPHQGGKSHLNEQWPSYWTRLFAEHSFRPWDLFRREIWNEEEVEYWYAQNMLLFLREGEESKYPCLREAPQEYAAKRLDVVHPRHYLRTIHEKQSIEKALWNCRAELVKIDVENQVLRGAILILADDGTLALSTNKLASVVRLCEIDGTYQGPPPDSRTAIQRIERLRQLRGRFLVLTWQVFWWETYFAGLTSYLKREAVCLLRNDRCRIYQFVDKP